MKEHSMRRKYICWTIMCFMAVWTGLALTGQAKVKAPKKECHAYVVMDAGSGKVLFGQDEDKQIYPASTAKLMTAVVCIEQGDVDSMIRTEYDVVNGTTPGAYAVGMPANTKFSFRDLLNLSLIASAADATDSLAVGVFGSKKACADAMNKKCKELGLTHTSFDNPVGNDVGAGFEETYATAREMAIITRYAMTIPMIRNIVAKSGYGTRHGADIYVNTTNWFLTGAIPYDTDRYKIIGSKTGTTNAAGHVFIATAVDDKGHEVICAYFGNVSKESTFNSIRSLLDFTFKKYKEGKLTLTNGAYDVRCDGEAGDAYAEFADKDCFPVRKSGQFMPNLPVTRKQLARMMRSIDGMKGNKRLACFVAGNENGRVTSRDLARLTGILYPHLHVSLVKEDEILTDCTGIDDMTDDEQTTFAACIHAGLLPNEECRNASNIISRKEALLYASRLRKLEPAYSLAHPGGVVGQIDENGRIIFSMPDLKDQIENSIKEKEAKEDNSEKEEKKDKNKKPEKEEKKEDKKEPEKEEKKEDKKAS